MKHDWVGRSNPPLRSVASQSSCSQWSKRRRSMTPATAMRRKMTSTLKKQFSGNQHTSPLTIFADANILNLLGGHGFGAAMMNRRDRLLEGVPSVNMCKEKTETKSRKSRVNNFNNPITTVKNFASTDESKWYTMVHSNFQSTS
jgi:hypothetical protein